MSMKQTIRVLLLISLAMTLAFSSGCNVSGANIRLEGVSLGTVTMEEKPIEGLPSDKINLVLEVSAQTVLVSLGAEETILTLVPSGATIEIKGNSVSIKGVNPEQIKVEWAVSKQN